MKWLLMIASIQGILAVSSCSSTPTGVVLMKIDDRIAHIELPPGAVRVGDTISLIESRCPRGPRPYRTREPASKNCRKVVRGQGKVTRLFNDRYSEVAFPSGLNFDTGDAVRPELPAERPPVSKG